MRILYKQLCALTSVVKFLQIFVIVDLYKVSRTKPIKSKNLYKLN